MSFVGHLVCFLFVALFFGSAIWFLSKTMEE